METKTLHQKEKDKAKLIIENFYNVQNFAFKALKEEARRSIAKLNAETSVQMIIMVLDQDEVNSNEEIYRYWKLVKEFIQEYEFKPDYEDTALTMMQLLANTGATFEDEEIALGIMTKTLKNS